jgi:hypothetical protein
MSKLSYAALAKEAILALKERTGSSLAAIKTYIASKHPEVDFQAVSFTTTTCVTFVTSVVLYYSTILELH